MTKDQILAAYSRNYSDELFRGDYQVTAMTKSSDIERCRGEVVQAYLVPYLGAVTYVEPEEGDDDAIGIIVAGAIARLTFARLIYSNVWRSEYAAAKPSKQNAAAAERAEIVRQAATYRRMAMATLEDLRKDQGLRATPAVTSIPILGEEL